MKIKPLIVALCLFSFSSLVSARVCNEDQQDAFDYYAETAAQRLVEQYEGGRDIVVLPKRCSYNRHGRTYKGEIDVYWNGVLMRSNRYNVEGVLTLRASGKSDFSETYANTILKDFRQWRNVVIGGVIVLGVIGENLE